MRKSKKALATVVAGIMLGASFLAPAARAANPTEPTTVKAAGPADSQQTEENLCVIKGKLETLKALTQAPPSVKKLSGETLPAASSTPPKNQELSLRKDILTLVVRCAGNETESLLSTIRDIPLVGKDEQDTQQIITNSIDRALRTYRSFEEDIAALETVEGAKAHAVQIAEWRESQHLPLAETARNFILWTNNQNLIEKARTRLLQIKQSIVALRLTQNEAVQLSFERARTFLLRADDEHIRARQSIERSEVPDRSLDHLKQSLGELYRTYGAFLEVTDVMRKALQE